MNKLLYEIIRVNKKSQLSIELLHKALTHEKVSIFKNIF